MKKKWAMLLTAVLLTGILAGCGSGAKQTGGSEQQTKPAEQGTTAAADETAAATAAPESAGKTADKIIIGATGLQEDQFTQILLKGYKDAAAELFEYVYICP